MNRREFFDRHARSWDSQVGVGRGEGLRRVVEECSLEPGSLVLDLGTGTGVLIPHILGEIGSRGRVLAVDVSQGMLTEAREKFREENVLFVRADAHHLCAPEAAFDRVVCNAAFPHFADRELTLREMIRVLRPGGVLVISHPVGREAVNARHRAAGGPVAEDRVPAVQAMEALLGAAGLQQVVVVDEPDFYLARGRRSG